MPLIVGAAFLLLLLMLGRAYVGTDARSLGKAVRMAGAALLALLALFIAVRGQIGFAIFLGLTSWAVATGGEMPWKKNTSFGAGPGQAPPQAPQPPGGMSRQEALKVLGLEPSATKDEIRAAHRRLILQNHPDKGGTTYLAAKINQAKDVLLDDRLMRVHIFDQQLGRGPGHPPICDGLVAEALRRRGIETILYGAIAPSDHTPPVDDAVPTFRGTMWDHVGRDALTWPLEDYVQLGEQTAADLVALGAERFANDDIAFFPNLSQNEIGGIRSWVQTLPEDNRPILILKFSVLTWATPRFQDYRNKNLIPLLYRFGMKGLLAAHPRTVLCTDSEEMAAAFRNVAELTLPVLPLPLFIDPPKERAAEHLTVAYLGYASPWKGFQLLPQIVSEFGKSAPQANGRNVRFIFQSFGDEKLCAEVEGALAGNEAVTFIRGDVSRERYVGLVQEADILLMPYAAMIYGWASSGVFTEGLSAGKIAVVPEQTWQARQLTQYQAGGTTFATQEPAPIAAALRQAVTEYDALRAKADAARTPWKARHNPESFVDQMLSLAAMVAR